MSASEDGYGSCRGAHIFGGPVIVITRLRHLDKIAVVLHRVLRMCAESTIHERYEQAQVGKEPIETRNFSWVEKAHVAVREAGSCRYSVLSSGSCSSLVRRVLCLTLVFLNPVGWVCRAGVKTLVVPRQRKQLIRRKWSVTAEGELWSFGREFGQSCLFLRLR